MRMPVVCDICRWTGSATEAVYVDVSDDGVCEGHSCPNGHPARYFVVDEMKHTVLFQSGAVALLYGFRREAVSSAHVALERFFEFATRVLWLRVGQGKIPDEAVNETWKRMAAQSERQLGAFLAMYLVEFKEPFPWGRLRMDDLVRARNKVVHGGRIPTKPEAVAYLRGVYEVIESTLARMRFFEETIRTYFDLLDSGPYKRLRERETEASGGPGLVQRSSEAERRFQSERIFVLSSRGLPADPHFGTPPTDFAEEFRSRMDHLARALARVPELRVVPLADEDFEGR